MNKNYGIKKFQFKIKSILKYWTYLFKQILCFTFFIHLCSFLILGEILSLSSKAIAHPKNENTPQTTISRVIDNSFGMTPSSHKIIIATSIPILKQITEEIVPLDSIEVISLTSSNEDSHHFELSPKAIIQIKNYSFLIYNGLGLDNHWAESLKKYSSIKISFIEASKNIIIKLMNSNNTYDPHAWHNPDNIISYIESISEELLKSFALSKQNTSLNLSIQKKSKLLIEKIKQWKNNKWDLFNKKFLMKKKELSNETFSKALVGLTMHSEFNYLFHYFQIPTHSIFTHHDTETLSPKELTLILNNIQKYQKRIFYNESNLNPLLYKDWIEKTKSQKGGTLWNDVPSSMPHSVLQFLDHNAEVIIQSVD